MTSDSEDLALRSPEAPFGAQVPRMYRKRPEEALTAQAYFFLFWWYRPWLILFIVGTLLLVGAVVLFLTGATVVASSLGVLAVTIQAVGGFGWSLGRMEAPKGNMALSVDSDGPAP